MKDFGCMNGWVTNPEEVSNCRHDLKVETIGKCLVRYTCEECKFTYTVDSSD